MTIQKEIKDGLKELIIDYEIDRRVLDANAVLEFLHSKGVVIKGNENIDWHCANKTTFEVKPLIEDKDG